MPDSRRHRPWRWALALLALVLVAVVVGAAIWLRPLPPTEPAARILTDPPAGVSVTQDAQAITLSPTGRPRGGLVFQPGARVDPGAYAAILAPLANEGHVVAIIRQPLGVGLLAVSAPTGLMHAHPDVEHWAVGGHSLGGVAAAQYVADHPQGPRCLLLWASYPAGSLADRTDLRVASIGGSADGLTTPAELEASRTDLPPGTQVTVVEGASHAQFGDYGPQQGDGVATLERVEAQQQILAATQRLLADMSVC